MITTTTISSTRVKPEAAALLRDACVTSGDAAGTASCAY